MRDTLSREVASLLGFLLFTALTIAAIYVVARLVFLREPPSSKPSQERHGKLTE